jgi:hypothetical protein
MLNLQRHTNLEIDRVCKYFHSILLVFANYLLLFGIRFLFIRYRNGEGEDE